MTEEVSEAFKLGIDFGLSALVLAGVISVFMLTQNISTSMANQQAAASSIKDYREYVRYDDNVYFYFDVINAVKEYWDEDIAVFICNEGSGGALDYCYKKGKYKTLTYESATSNYLSSEYVDAIKTTNEIMDRVAYQGYYRSKLVVGPNGNVVAISFHQCNSDGTNPDDWVGLGFAGQID